MKITRAWLVDAAERVGATFGEAFLASFGLQGIIALSAGHIDFTAVHVAEQAGIAAVLALVKAAFAAKVKRTVSPASLAPLTTAAPSAGLNVNIIAEMRRLPDGIAKAVAHELRTQQIIAKQTAPKPHTRKPKA